MLTRFRGSVVSAALALSAGAIACGTEGFLLQQRNEASFVRGPYNTAFFWRHPEPYRFQAAVHVAHALQHDRLELTPLDRHAAVDERTDAEYLDVTRNPPRIGPHMMPYGPHVGQAIWKLYLAIDWTHQHHDQTYDSLMSRDVPWSEKERWTRRSVERYLARHASLPRSPAPLDVTMRRAAVMGKPYFTLFRNRYPLSNNYFFVAHWWHPVIYEAVMIAGNDEEQEQAVRETHALTEEVLRDRPQRMLLAREVMPRYARFSPESANIFDNLHMLHGIAYDILAYEGWSMEEKRRELERVIEAMSYQPGDKALARKFALPYPEMDPRVYADWMKPAKGAMSRIMEEMLEEMWPGMSPDGSSLPPTEVMDQFRKKMTPGMQPGEHAGSLMQALGEVAPGMHHDPASMKPGEAAPKMVATMLDGWRGRHGSQPDVAPLPMEEDPALPPVGSQHATVMEGLQ